jgi:hypothetical protein
MDRPTKLGRTPAMAAEDMGHTGCVSFLARVAVASKLLVDLRTYLDQGEYEEAADLALSAKAQMARTEFPRMFEDVLAALRHYI